LTYFASQSDRVSAVAFLKNQKIAESLCAEGCKITHAQNGNPLSDFDEILHFGRYHDVVTYTYFGVLGAEGQISFFPIDFDRRPYSMRVIINLSAGNLDDVVTANLNDAICNCNDA